MIKTVATMLLGLGLIGCDPKVQFHRGEPAGPPLVSICQIF